VNGAAAQPDFPRGRVLVVDDEPNIADVISIALRYNDYEVAIAASGQEALEAVENSAPT
jgi:two-component system, OmpR family, response regulator